MQHDRQFWPPHRPLNTPQAQSLNYWWEQLSCLIRNKYKMLSNLIFRCPNCRERSIFLREWRNSDGLWSDWTIWQEVHQLSPPKKYLFRCFLDMEPRDYFHFRVPFKLTGGIRTRNQLSCNDCHVPLYISSLSTLCVLIGSLHRSPLRLFLSNMDGNSIVLLQLWPLLILTPHSCF